MSEPADSIGRRWGAPREATSAARVDRKQTGCCCEAQADGVPCESIDCACESCARSAWVPPMALRYPVL